MVMNYRLLHASLGAWVEGIADAFTDEYPKKHD